MTQKFSSAIFEGIWMDTLKYAQRHNPNMSIDDMSSCVWEPTFTKCQEIKGQLQKKSISLSDVDKYFGPHKGETLEKELDSLVRGIDYCCNEPSDLNWICQAVQWINKYWKLCAQCEAVNSFLKLRDTLKLTEGDFSVVETISTEVIFHTILGILCMYSTSHVLHNNTLYCTGVINNEGS